MLKNYEVFLRDPRSYAIPNDGVAKIGEPRSPQEWEVLRYELESFVCDGEYERGLERILSAFLTNFQRAQQPAVWISGFYGSGKTHLARVLEYLWRDVEFPDGARARSLVTLPPDIRALLVELTRLGKPEGGLWAAAGKLAAGAGPVRPGLLSILFQSAGLPTQYPAARFVIWLKQNDYFDRVKDGVEARGKDFDAELRNLYVSPYLADALLDAIPGFATSSAEARSLLRNQYPAAPEIVLDISDDELRSTMRDVLHLQSTARGQLPLTLLILDELQQFIGDDPIRTLHVQDVVEECSARFGSRLLVVATGQSALQDTTQLQKLQGRFSVSVALSDLDVDKVVREVVLRKAPDKVAALKNLLDASSGEIDRQLAGTKIGSRPEDAADRVADYPLLPVRRRFWERALRSIDSLGTAGQLRTQLKIVHEATRGVANQVLGVVVPADALYWNLEANMLQTKALPRDVATIIQEIGLSGDDGPLRKRLCALIFLIGKLESGGPTETGVRATAETLADLAVGDLTVGSAALRQQVPVVLRDLVDHGRLLLVGDEYRLQTKESADWEDDYKVRYNRIFSDDARLASDRGTALRAAVAPALKGLAFIQGVSKTVRKFDPHFSADAPPNSTSTVPVWIRDEWSVSEKSVRDEAQAAGPDSSVVYVFLPRLASDDLKQALARAGAASETVKVRADPQTEGGKDARLAMASRAEMARGEVATLAGEVVSSARVFQGGGNEIAVDSFPKAVTEAVDAALIRLFPKFSIVDMNGWDKVVKRASEGAVDALSALGYGAEVDKHPSCQEVRQYVGGTGKKGVDVRKRFMDPPYGWPKDAVDGSLLALLAAGFLRATLDGQEVDARDLNQTQLGRTEFFIEGVVVSGLHRIEIRRLATAVGLSVKSGEEADAIPRVLERLVSVAQGAGGEPPQPEWVSLAALRDLQALSGKRQLVAVYEQREQLLACHQTWTGASEAIRERLPRWRRLEELLHHARDLPVPSEIQAQVDAIRTARSLLDNPDPVRPLVGQLAAALRHALREAHDRLRDARDREVGSLEASSEWPRLSPEEQQRLLKTNGLLPIPDLDVGTDEALLKTLEATPLRDWEERLVAVPARAAKTHEEAVKLLEPKAVKVRPRPATLKSVDDVGAYLDELRACLLNHIDAGNPVVIL